MKKIIPLLFLVFLLQQNTNAQHLISYQLVHHYTIQDVQTILNNFGASSYPITPYYELDYYKITYSTSNARGTGNTIATGAIVVPSGVTCPMPIMSYQHGTEAHRYSVPSYRGGSEYNIGVIGASISGCIVSMPDYLGLGDSPGLHPYINARTEASATIDLLRTVRELKDSIGYNLNDQLFLFGYSQGGHSTMAVFKEIETNLSNEFTVTACAPMSGPYDVSGVQAATITADAPYATPGYLPYVIMGQQEAFGNVYNSLSDVFKSPYDTLFPSYFDGTHSMGWINNQVPDTPNLVLDSAYFQSFLNDPNHPGWSILRANDLYRWAPTAPLTMYYCTADEQVFYQNSLVARDTMHALGATHVNAVSFGNLDHTGCAPYCFLVGFGFFDYYMDVTGGMIASANVIDASTGGSADGAIDIIPTYGVGPYNYIWENPLTGQTTATVSGLVADDYRVRISDSRGCYTYQDVTVSVASSLDKIDNTVHFKVMPNPAQDIVYLKVLTLFENNYDINIIDMLGRTVHQTLNTALPVLSYDISDLPNGTYIVHLKHNDAVYTQKLSVQR